MAFGDGMKEYHCTQPCYGYGDRCPFKKNVHFGTELPAAEGMVKVHSLFQEFHHKAYGVQPMVRYWEVYAQNGGVEPGYCRFVCTLLVHAKIQPTRYSGPLAPQNEEEPF